MTSKKLYDKKNYITFWIVTDGQDGHRQQIKWIGSFTAPFLDQVPLRSLLDQHNDHVDVFLFDDNFALSQQSYQQEFVYVDQIVMSIEISCDKCSKTELQ